MTRFTLTADQIVTLTAIVASADRPHMAMIAEAYGTTKNTLIGFCYRRGIVINPLCARKPATPPAERKPRYTSPKARKPTADQRFGAFGKPKKLAPIDRAEMDRPIAQAVAEGKVTKLRPGYAWGANPNSWIQHVGKAS